MFGFVLVVYCYISIAIFQYCYILCFIHQFGCISVSLIMYISTDIYNVFIHSYTVIFIHSYYCILVNSQLVFCHFVFSSKSKICVRLWVRQKELIKKHFKNFLFLRSYFESLSVTGTNESNKRTFPWMFSFINVVNIISCFILYTSSFFSRTNFMVIVYFVPSVISSNNFVKIMWLCVAHKTSLKSNLCFIFLWD